MINIIQEKKQSKKQTIKAKSPIDKTLFDRILGEIKDENSLVFVKWNTVPGQTTDYKELWVTVRNNQTEEYVRVFTISGFNKFEDDKAVEMTVEEKKRINLFELKWILAHQPELILHTLNKITSPKQKYPKAFYGDVKKVIDSFKRPIAYIGSNLFSDLKTSFEKPNLQASIALKIGENYHYARITFYDLEHKVFDKEVQYVLKLDQPELEKLGLDQHKTVEELINDPNFATSISNFEFLPNLEYSYHKKITENDNTDKNVIEFAYKLTRPRK